MHRFILHKEAVLEAEIQTWQSISWKEKSMMTLQAEKALSAEDFKFAFRGHPAGVGVVTADIGEGPVAMTVSSLISVGIEPPTLVFSASGISSAAPSILKAKTVVVHLLGAEQLELAKLGATSGVERFGEKIGWSRLPSGEPYYLNVPSLIRGRVSRVVPVGGSHLVVVEALQSNPHGPESAEQIPPLVYHNRSWHALGEQSKLQ
ncbi:flavin reductase family protein [Arthrobacter sp. NPDC089319]|uniref:flavin reductase family protein n=1 Tax=Arthrobacter sp. NPDC089319 TaxID=3155915 RepID=UPI003418EE8C